MTTLTFTRHGAGAPLLLLHGIGSSRDVWEPVLATLAAQFDVIAVDLPGFGGSPQLPSGVEPNPAALAASIAEFLDTLAVANPHVAGNSLGGWVALELARIRPVESLTLLSPAGLWSDRTPMYCRISLRASRWMARNATGLLRRLMKFRLGRLLVLGQTHGRPAQLAPEYARAVISAMAVCPGFEAALEATLDRCYRGPSADVSVTLAFGTRDWLLRKRQSRHIEELPPNTQLEALPRCGHVPMADDPIAVAALITSSARRHQFA
jgi:pimeloyl-ACP methyl ester carboxylesterase